MKNMTRFLLIFISLLFSFGPSYSQSKYFGADMSYVNEMEHCGVVYKEDNNPKDPYAIFKDHGGNLVRLRLWHTPSWYDQLNDGSRFSDLSDVEIAIGRAKSKGLNVLLDFHLSDNWADPSKQLVPAAWLPVVDNTSVLKDSLYNYIFKTLTALHDKELMPDMVQIGNETNKGILLSPEDNEGWTLNWNRNAILFNSALKAVKDCNQLNGTDVETVLHLADPSNAEWLIDGFTDNGVTDFDIIAMSYYWAWHQPTTIEETGDIIEMLRSLYPDKEVLIVETGYIWTNDFNDDASNIISSTHPDYHPASPENQRDWLIDLTQEVIDSDGLGVVYWEPFWVSSVCFTQWGQGSHQEHATYFDFDNNLIQPGGIDWMSFDYGLNTSTIELDKKPMVQILSNSTLGEVVVKQLSSLKKELDIAVLDMGGNTLIKEDFNTAEHTFQLQDIPSGMYIISVSQDSIPVAHKKVLFHHN